MSRLIFSHWRLDNDTMSKIARIFARANGTIAHVWDELYTPDDGATLRVTFHVDSYQTEFQHIADHAKQATWDGANLRIDGNIYLSAAWIAARLAEVNAVTAEAAQVSSAKATRNNLMTGLHNLSDADKGYVIACRIMAYKDGATNQVIMAIVDRATATSYITSKPEWTNAPAATRNLVADVLEMFAGIVQVSLPSLTD